MLSRLRTAGLLWPTLLSFPALILLVSLGNWQMSRKAWKEALLAQIDAGLKAAPATLDEVIRAKPGKEFPEYARVKVTGRFEHDAERYFYAPDPRLGPGFHVYTPLLMEDGRRVMVNRGYVPEALRSPDSRARGQIGGNVEVIGLLRAVGQKAAFTPDNDPSRNLWFWRDVEAMLGCGPRVRCPSHVRGFVDAEAEPANPGGWPRGGATNFQIVNRHLEYALTWYGLAVTLVAMFLVFAVPRLRTVEKG